MATEDAKRMIKAGQSPEHKSLYESDVASRTRRVHNVAHVIPRGRIHDPVWASDQRHGGDEDGHEQWGGNVKYLQPPHKSFWNAPKQNTWRVTHPVKSSLDHWE